MIAGAITGVLMLLFGREPKGVLPEGFCENGWLDVDDKYLVYLTDSHLYSVSIDKKQVGTMQKLYQSVPPSISCWPMPVTSMSASRSAPSPRSRVISIRTLST